MANVIIYLDMRMYLFFSLLILELYLQIHFWHWPFYDNDIFLSVYLVAVNHLQFPATRNLLWAGPGQGMLKFM